MVKLPKINAKSDFTVNKKVRIARRNKRGLSSGFVSTLETKNPFILKDHLNDVILKRGFKPVDQYSDQERMHYSWKLGIRPSRSYEIEVSAKKDGIPVKIAERSLKWIHCTILSDRRETIEMSGNVNPANDIRVLIETSKSLDPSSDLFKFVFSSGKLPVNPIIKEVNGKPTLCREMIADKAFKSIYVARKITNIQRYTNGFTDAAITSGMIMEGSHLNVHRKFCDIALYHNTQNLKDVIFGNKPSQILKETFDVLINDSVGLSDDIEKYFSS